MGSTITIPSTSTLPSRRREPSAVSRGIARASIQVAETQAPRFHATRSTVENGTRSGARAAGASTRAAAMAAAAPARERCFSASAKARKNPGARCTAPRTTGSAQRQSPEAKPHPCAASHTAMVHWNAANQRTALLPGLNRRSSAVPKHVTPRAKNATAAADGLGIRR